MKPPRHVVPILLTVVALTGSRAESVAAENAYGTIISRNGFDLRPAIIAEPIVAPAPKATVQLTGITAFANNKKAWFVINDQSGRGLRFVCLHENECRDGIEVVTISKENNEVLLKRDGVPAKVSIKEPKF